MKVVFLLFETVGVHGEVWGLSHFFLVTLVFGNVSQPCGVVCAAPCRDYTGKRERALLQYHRDGFPLPHHRFRPLLEELPSGDRGASVRC